MVAEIDNAMDLRVRNAIEKLVRERLADAAVEEVRITADKDEDGQRVYRVMVVFEPARGKLNADKTSSLTRHIRHKLLELQEPAFPFFRFVSCKDAKALAAA